MSHLFSEDIVIFQLPPTDSEKGFEIDAKYLWQKLNMHEMFMGDVTAHVTDAMRTLYMNRPNKKFTFLSNFSNFANQHFVTFQTHMCLRVCAIRPLRNQSVKNLLNNRMFYIVLKVLFVFWKINSVRFSFLFLQRQQNCPRNSKGCSVKRCNRMICRTDIALSWSVFFRLNAFLHSVALYFPYLFNWFLFHFISFTFLFLFVRCAFKCMLYTDYLFSWQARYKFVELFFCCQEK